MYFAIHLVSQSCDHYNMLVQAETPEQLVEQVKANCGDFAYIDQIYVDSEVYEENEKYHRALAVAIDDAYNEENDGEY